MLLLLELKARSILADAMTYSTLCVNFIRLLVAPTCVQHDDAPIRNCLCGDST